MGSKFGGLSSIAFFQMYVCKWACFTFLVHASVVSGKEQRLGVVVDSGLPVCYLHILIMTSDIELDFGYP